MLSLSEERQIWGLFACDPMKSTQAAEASVLAMLRSVKGVPGNSPLGSVLRQGQREAVVSNAVGTGKVGVVARAAADCDALHFRASNLEVNGKSWENPIFLLFLSLVLLSLLTRIILLYPQIESAKCKAAVKREFLPASRGAVCSVHILLRERKGKCRERTSIMDTDSSP